MANAEQTEQTKRKRPSKSWRKHQRQIKAEQRRRGA